MYSPSTTHTFLPTKVEAKAIHLSFLHYIFYNIEHSIRDVLDGLCRCKVLCRVGFREEIYVVPSAAKDWLLHRAVLDSRKSSKFEAGQYLMLAHEDGRIVAKTFASS